MATQRDQHNSRSKAASFRTEALEGRRMLDATITATVFYDLNGDGVFDPGEPNPSNYRIYIDLNDNGQFDNFENGSLTDTGGVATITGLTANTAYKVAIVLVSGEGYTTTSPRTITTGADNSTTDAGDYGIGRGRISGRVWVDANGNGSYNAGEGTGSVRVYLDLNGNGELDDGETRTWSAPKYMPDGVTPNPDAGNYRFSLLLGDEYDVRISPPGSQLVITSNPIHMSLDTMQNSDDNDFGLTSPAAVVAPNDFNGDDKSDIIVTDGGVSTIWYMDGVTRTGTAPLPSLGAGYALTAYSDFDGNGKPDLLAYNASTGSAKIILMKGVSSDGQVVLPTATTQWKPVGAGDFNGDGHTDIAWRNQSTGQNTTWLMSGTSVMSFKALPSTADNNWYIAGVGDFNNDGKDDLVWRHSVSGRNTTWLLNGTSTPTFKALPSTADQNWRPVAISAFNGDNIPDILWLNNVTHDNSIWFMTAGQPTFGRLVIQV